MASSRPTDKSFASLAPSLLARKGGAKPAMRAQLGDAGLTIEDLGWNDFGLADPADFADAGSVVAFPPREVPRKAARRPRGAKLNEGGKAAFTLRLDAERHLKLRLACTLDACSAQALVTEALDRVLADMPELDALAGEVVRRRRS
jgi:hypothetical protein